MTILGVDPGLKNVGWGVVQQQAGQRLTHVAHGTIITSDKLSLSARLEIVYQELTKVVHLHQPQVMAIEALLFQKNVSSALPVAHVRGVILLLAQLHALGVRSFAPNTIKQAVTGNGRAVKHDVMHMVKVLLKLANEPTTDHAADALACAITAAYGTPVVSDKLT